jgi:hypothetical protein
MGNSWSSMEDDSETTQPDKKPDEKRKKNKRAKTARRQTPIEQEVRNTKRSVQQDTIDMPDYIDLDVEELPLITDAKKNKQDAGIVTLVKRRRSKTVRFRDGDA